MTKKRIIALLIAVVVVTGGIWGVKFYLDTKAHEAYLASPDRIADQLQADLVTGNAQDAYNNHFTTLLKENYSLNYWQQRVDSPFTLLKNYKGTSKMVFKKPTSEVTPQALYPQDANPQTYQYEYLVNNVTYHVTFVVANVEGSWHVNELGAGYVK